MRSCRVLVLAFILLLGLTSQASGAFYPLIVRVSPTVSIDTVAATLGGTVADSIPGANTYLLVVPMVPLPARATLLGIQWMELNKTVSLPRFGLRQLLSVPGSASADWYKLQPATQLIRAGNAAPFSTGRGVVVADINSQVDYAHPALAGHLTGGFDFIATSNGVQPFLDQADVAFLDQADVAFLDQADVAFLEQADVAFLEQSDPAYLDGLNPAYSHGSLSAGVIAAIAPDSMIMPLRTFGDDGLSDYFSLAKAIRYAVDHGAGVINMNFGITSPSVTLKSAVDFALASNVVLVAPAGNNNTYQPQYPAAFPGVLAAAATDLSDTKALFSNYGSYLFATAPGVDVISVYPHGYYGLASGTSLSSAAVAATAVLVRSMQINGISDAIAGSAVNIDSRNPNYLSQLGHGRIDVLGALRPSGTAAITGVNPATGRQGQTLQLSVTGLATHFAQNTTQLNTGDGVTVTSVVVASPTSLTAQLSIAANAALGSRAVTVTTGAEVVTLNDGFAITPADPVLTGVEPNTAKQNDSVTVNITGQFTNFAQGTTQVSLGDGITINSISVSSPTALSVQASVSPAAAVGARTVTVTSGTEVATLAGAFNVTPATPALTGTSPNSAKQGNTVTIAVTGQFTHFAQGTTQVSLGDGVTISSITVSSPTALSVQASVSPAAAVAGNAVTVTTGSEVVTLANSFSVTAAPPALTAITPNTANQGDTVTIAITGQFTHFAQGATQVDLGSGFTVDAVTVSGNTTITAQVSVSADVSTGPYAVTVTTGTESIGLSDSFAVAAIPVITVTPIIPVVPPPPPPPPPPVTPIITGINSNNGKQGDVLTIALSGQYTNFQQGLTQADFGDGIAVDNVTVVDSSDLLINLVIADSAAIGNRNVTVTTGSGVVSLNGGFSVTAAAPTPVPLITSVDPLVGVPGAAGSITVIGNFTNFVQDVTQVSLGDGISVDSIAVANPTSLTLQLTIGVDAAAGPRTLVVTTGDEVVRLDSAFTIAVPAGL